MALLLESRYFRAVTKPSTPDTHSKFAGWNQIGCQKPRTGIQLSKL